MNDPREGRHSVRASRSQCWRARALVPSPRRGRGRRARRHGGKASRRSILGRPVYRGRLPVTWNMVQACDTGTVRVYQVPVCETLSTRLGPRIGEQTPPPIQTRETSHASESHVLTIRPGGLNPHPRPPGRRCWREGARDARAEDRRRNGQESRWPA